MFGFLYVCVVKYIPQALQWNIELVVVVVVVRSRSSSCSSTFLKSIIRFRQYALPEECDGTVIGAEMKTEASRSVLVHHFNTLFKICVAPSRRFFFVLRCFTARQRSNKFKQNCVQHSSSWQQPSGMLPDFQLQGAKMQLSEDKRHHFDISGEHDMCLILLPDLSVISLVVVNSSDEFRQDFRVIVAAPKFAVSVP